MITRVVIAVLAVTSAVVVAGCNRANAPAENAAPAAAADASHAGHGRVFFVSPKNGETVKNPVQFEFGSETITIAAVPQGDVKETRPGMAHYHLGIDTGCTPVGEVIPRGVPTWVHFGTGSNKIEYPGTPGAHKFSLQAGDDLHRAIDGLCETIEVTIAE
jgi:hypothetical protein